MNDIKKISIVCSAGSETYQIGQKVNGRIVSKIERLSGFEDSEGCFIVKDKEGYPISEISDNTPYVIEYV